LGRARSRPRTGPRPDRPGYFALSPRRDRWTSFVATDDGRSDKIRALHEEDNPRHRLRVEHDDRTLLIHLSGEDGQGWTTIAIDRDTREWSVAQGVRQADTAREAHQGLYGRDGA
jgi:hypothetical protein